MDCRKVVFLRETLFGEGGAEGTRPVHRAAALAVIANPYAGKNAANLEPLYDVGAALGERLMGELVALLGGKPVSYGKAAIVGVNGEMEHGAAVLHPKLGKPMRAAVGGGEAIIASNVKVAAAGAPIDVPLNHKDNIWSFDELDTMTVMIADAPRPDEIVVVLTIADGGRVRSRIAKGRV
ncbi:MAG TPA: amino acid synthesis family protein [Burkholderiales bacterium]|nr:amino acid synthesis family protein [Burkholderiales bacterium]